MEKKNFVHRILSYIKALFLSGFFMILPIIVTVFILTFTYTFVARWLIPLRKIQPLYLQKIPGSEFILVTIFILAIGFLLKLFFIRPIIHWFENLINKIPIIRSIYSSSKILIDFFSTKKVGAEKRKVILIEFPKKGFFNIAFLLEPATNDFQKLIPEDKILSGQTYYKIFMPNSPNPMTGYFLVLPESEIIKTNMSFDEAIRAIVSAGLVTPESIKK